MKTHLKPQLLPLFSVGLGTAAMLLRFFVYLFTTDGKGLLISGHPLQILLWLVVAAAAAVIALSVLPLKGTNRYEDNFPGSPVACAGCLAMALSIGITVLRHGMGSHRVEILCAVSGVLAAVSLVAMGFFRWKGKAMGFGFPAMVCLYVSAYTICFFPGWSSNPQILDTLFRLLGCMGLMVVSYQHTAFCVGLGKRQVLLAASFLSVLCCMTAVPGNEDFLLYLGGALWALTNPCAITLPHSDRKE